MRQYRIGDLATGKGYTTHATSPRVALNRVFGNHIDEFLNTGDCDNGAIMHLIVTDLGESVVIQRVVEAPTFWAFNGAQWYGWPRTEEQRVLVADGIPDGWNRISSTKIDTRIHRDSCGICGAKSPQEDTHNPHSLA
jgi:hypothetical protein